MGEGEAEGMRVSRSGPKQELGNEQQRGILHDYHFVFSQLSKIAFWSGVGFFTFEAV